VGYSAKDAKYLTNWLMIDQKTTELAEVKIRASRCCCAAVRKGHMIEQVTTREINVPVEKFTKQLTQRKKVIDSLIYRKY